MKLLTSVCVCVCVNSPVQNQDAPSLQNISLSVGSRQLVAVIGPVGAGKVRAPFLHYYGFFNLPSSIPKL